MRLGSLTCSQEIMTIELMESQQTKKEKELEQIASQALSALVIGFLKFCLLVVVVSLPILAIFFESSLRGEGF